MKKFLAIIAIASFAVACNNSGEKTETTDTPAVTAPATVDSPVAAPVDTAAKASTDTAAAAPAK